jgi:carbonic anhydrase
MTIISLNVTEQVANLLRQNLNVTEQVANLLRQNLNVTEQVANLLRQRKVRSRRFIAYSLENVTEQVANLRGDINLCVFEVVLKT